MLDVLEQDALSKNKKLCYPLCVNKTDMKALMPKDENAFVSGAFGIMEPDKNNALEISPEDIDLVIAPCTAFDEECRRIGMGAGYYDRYLPKCKNAYAAAAAFGIQKIQNVPTDIYDKTLDAVVSEEKVYYAYKNKTGKRNAMSIQSEVRLMKKDAPFMAASSLEMRNNALGKIKENLIANAEEIFEANKKDMKAAEENKIASAVMKRLKFDQGKLNDVIAGIDQLILLPDPIGKTTLSRSLDDGLTLYRVTCPIGIIGVIFEARPDALVQISTLCIKSGNCAVLKGGKETAETNRALFKVIHESIVEAGLPERALLQVQQHSEIDELLQCHDCVDLLIPRGSNAFVQYIMNNTKIPVMGHADGLCHIYVDSEADLEKAISVLIDAKTQYTAACNAVETLLVNRNIAKEFLPMAAKALTEAKVKIYATEEAANIIRESGFEAESVDEQEFKEYLDMAISIKLVADVDEAIAHINAHGSHHTDSVITESRETAEKFMNMVDSAGVYHNCSTRFADGFRYGFGAEVGISTGKIHARGPVGLEGLVTYKYKLFGEGHIVGDYASGRRHFNFKDL